MNAHEVHHAESAATPARSPSARSGEQRSEFGRLYRRYQYLSRCTSAADQRERTTLQGPLMELYRALHPDMVSVHFEDDFDTLMRQQRRS